MIRELVCRLEIFGRRSGGHVTTMRAERKSRLTDDLRENMREDKGAAKYFELPTGGDVRQIPVKWESRHPRA